MLFSVSLWNVSCVEAMLWLASSLVAVIKHSKSNLREERIYQAYSSRS